MNEPSDKSAIDRVIEEFFRSFDNASGDARLDGLAALCIDGVGIMQAGSKPDSLQSFIAPRQALLSSGQWLDFQERELDEVTTVFSDIAQRESRYRKRWRQAGAEFTVTGHKFFQLMRTVEGWKITSVLWQDDA
jgi:acyl carrier protein phosphodiesterase